MPEYEPEAPAMHRYEANVTVTFADLTVTAANKAEATALVKGLDWPKAKGSPSVSLRDVEVEVEVQVFDADPPVQQAG